MYQMPVKTFGDFVVTFEAQPEEMSARTHFVKECGWTESQFRKIKDLPFFCAKVAIWKEGEELAAEYLGCCSYLTVREFYTRYEGDYFADMVHTCADTIGDADLMTMVNAWREALRVTT